MHTKLLIYILPILGVLLIAFLVLLRGYHNKVSRSFAWLDFSIASWLAILFVADVTTSDTIALVALRLGVAISLVMATLFLFFAYNITYQKIRHFFLYIVYLLLAILTPFTIFTNAIVPSVTIDSSGAQISEVTFFYTFHTILLITYFITGITVVYRFERRSSGIEKKQMMFLLFAVLIAFITNIITGYILEALKVTGVGNLVGAFSLFIFSIITAYAIIKHRLFDIRLVVARSLGYLLSIGLIAFLYGVIAFAFIDKIPYFAGLSDGSKQAVYTLLAVIIALTFHPLKRFFDKLSNSLFYRDAYDSQELLDRLNNILVSTVDLGKMLQDTSTVVGDTLKTEFMAIGVPGTTGPDSYRIVSTDDRTFNKSDIKQAQILLPKMDGKVVVADYLENNHSKVKDLMQANDIATIVRMVDNPGQAQEDIGYIILGNKKSGSPFSGQDIKVLTMIADELVLAIQNALRFEEIQNFNKTLEKKVENATSRLQRANDKLVALDQTKDDFISMASHQLRTPLTSVKGYISMVLEGDAGKINEDQKNLLEQAFFSSQRMVYLISDLLNVSRLRTGKFIIEPTPVNLADIIESEVAQLKETAIARGLKLIYKKPKDFPVLMIDETKIRQVLTNFIDNAIYYTPSGGKIEVNLTNGRQSIELTVVDNGIGVAKHEQHNLFTKFFRAGNAKKARPDGTGLGLFMAKKVIIAQGGAIIFRSTEGKGSTFGFIFDKSRLQPKN